jgi:hypothetical protein
MNQEESLNVSSEKHLPAQELPGPEPRNQVGRRSFLRGLGIVGATLLPASAILMRPAKAQEKTSGRLPKATQIFSDSRLGPKL